MKRALQLDSSGGGLPAARCSPDRIEHLSPPVKRAKLAGSGSSGVAAIVVSVQSTKNNASTSVCRHPHRNQSTRSCSHHQEFPARSAAAQPPARLTPPRGREAAPALLRRCSVTMS